MQRPIPLSTLLRFPIIFGSFLIAGSVAFYYREQLFLNNVNEERLLLLKENAENRRLIEQTKDEMKKK